MLQFTFNPGLMLSGFRTTRPDRLTVVLFRLTKKIVRLTLLRVGGMVASSALDPLVISPGSSSDRGHCVLFLGRALNSHGASLHSGLGCSKAG